MPAIKTKEAVKQKLALAIVDDRRSFILYDTEALKNAVDKNNSVAKNADKIWLHSKPSIKKIIFGYIQISPPPRRPRLQYGARSVIYSAAKNGYGPLMYDLVMAFSHGLTSDRTDVTKSAKSVWDYYKSNRSDVKAKLLDDASNPKTRTTTDDSAIFPGDDTNPLNYAYFISKSPNVSALVTNHQSMKSFINKNDIDISSMGYDFFNYNYK